MNPDIKAQWVAALRSGEYKQNHDGWLRDEEDHYCCLGVLCDLAEKAGVLNRIFSEFSKAHLYGKEASHGALPDEALEWADVPYLFGGLGRLEPTSTNPNRALAFLNDDGMPFAQIADIIEREL